MNFPKILARYFAIAYVDDWYVGGTFMTLRPTIEPKGTSLKVSKNEPLLSLKKHATRY